MKSTLKLPEEISNLSVSVLGGAEISMCTHEKKCEKNFRNFFSFLYEPPCKGGKTALVLL